MIIYIIYNLILKLILMAIGYTLDNVQIGVQVSEVKSLPTGSFNYDNLPFYIKNNSLEVIMLEVRHVGSDTFISTGIFPGWNPEIVAEVRGNTSDVLQVGR